MDCLFDRLQNVLSSFSYVSVSRVENKNSSVSYWFTHQNPVFCPGNSRKVLFCKQGKEGDFLFFNGLCLSGLEVLSFGDDRLLKLAIDALRPAFSDCHFGCCGKYQECYANKKCLHSDLAYALACDYRKILESDRPVALI